MEGYKHFSHAHNLILHEVHDASEISCSGCNSSGSGSGTFYACWRCRFFLHEKCFLATRSLRHPSHPTHPLTLLPYPTYPSNSFYCNSCSKLGTGFSYGCSDCEFDLHVQCAYNISNAAIAAPQQQPVATDTNWAYLTSQSLFKAHAALVPEPIVPNTPFPSHPPKHENLATSSTKPEVFAPEAPPKADQPVELPHKDQHEPKTHGLVHFSHPHGLRLVNVRDGESPLTCSGCEDALTGSAYYCVESKCDFRLHNSCVCLARAIQHGSHPKHPLTLLSVAPYENGQFSCNACFKDGWGFTYHCSNCKFDLHVKCALLPDAKNREDHEHPLALVYKCPLKGEEYTFLCDVCGEPVHKNCWTYYCERCDFGTHLDCVDLDARKQGDSAPSSFLETQLQMQRLNMQMEMARQQAQLIASLGHSMSNLVG